MIDTITRKRLYVSIEGDGGPYIMVPIAQLEQVKHILTDAKVGYWVDEDAISLDGRPAVAVINLGINADSSRIQALLDKTK